MEESEDHMIDVSGKRIFLSGPMEGIEHNNVAAFAEAHDYLKGAGADYVFNPAIGYLCQSQRHARLRTHEDYMTDCIHELTDRRKRTQGWEDLIPCKYDMLVSLPGWEESRGASTERAVAVACGIECRDLAEVLA